MMCVTSLVTASKERQTGAKSCKAGKGVAVLRRLLSEAIPPADEIALRLELSADEIISFTLDKCEYRAAARRHGRQADVLTEVVDRHRCLAPIVAAAASLFSSPRSNACVSRAQKRPSISSRR